MSLYTHIETLQQKHSLLETMIDTESSRPLPDFMHISHLKKQKLVIKEELSSCLQQMMVGRQTAS